MISLPALFLLVFAPSLFPPLIYTLSASLASLPLSRTHSHPPFLLFRLYVCSHPSSFHLHVREKLSLKIKWVIYKSRTNLVKMLFPVILGSMYCSFLGVTLSLSLTFYFCVSSGCYNEESYQDDGETSIRQWYESILYKNVNM